MQSLPQLIQLIPTDTSYTNNLTDITDTTDYKLNNNKYGRYEADELYEHLPDLVNQRFRAWYCKHFYRLGKEKVLQLAAIARADSKRPAYTFSKLLKFEK